MSEYNLSIFDLKEGSEYHAAYNGNPYGLKYRRVGSELHVEHGYGWALSDNNINEMMFKEIKSKKKLYAYLKNYSDSAMHLCFYEKEHAQNAIRMPEFDREIEL